MNKTIHTPEGRFYLVYFRPEAEPNAVQVEGYFYPNDTDQEIEIKEYTYYAEPSISSALKDYIRRARREINA